MSWLPLDATSSPSRPAAAVAAASAGMAISMALVFVLATVAPHLLADLEVDRSWIGLTVGVSYSVAALAWRPAAALVEQFGAQRALVATVAVAGASLGLLAMARGRAELLAAAVVAGGAQALANPATNLLLVERVAEPSRRATAIGTKQAGVPLGAVLAGAALPVTADAWGWRPATAGAAVLALCVAAAIAATVPASTNRPLAPKDGGARPCGGAPLWWLVGFSVLLGAGASAVNTYLPLFATERLAVSARAAGTLTLLVGLTGLTARVVLSRLAAGADRATVALRPLALGASFAAVVLAAAPTTSASLAWVGAVVAGSTVVAANALTMLAVVQRFPPPATTRASALVSAGFFAGFAVGPPTFAVVAGAAARYERAWLVVATWLAGAAVVAGATVAPPPADEDTSEVPTAAS